MTTVLTVLSAFTLGALHALEPGHGKSVVAAYLVGTRGRVRDAVALGVIVTFTHTFSVITLGLLTVVAAAYLVPDTVRAAVEVVSGILVLGVGIWMVNGRIMRRGSHSVHPRVAQYSSQDHGHAHSLDHAHDPSPATHDRHDIRTAERPSLGSLITLGISGGIVPCPAALAILLATTAAGNVVGGLSLVVVFSLGLAVVLIAVGIALVKAARLSSRLLSERASGDLSRRAAVVSAVVVTVLGLAMTVRAISGVAGIHVLT